MVPILSSHLTFSPSSPFLLLRWRWQRGVERVYVCSSQMAALMLKLQTVWNGFWIPHAPCPSSSRSAGSILPCTYITAHGELFHVLSLPQGLWATEGVMCVLDDFVRSVPDTSVRKNLFRW